MLFSKLQINLLKLSQLNQTSIRTLVGVRKSEKKVELNCEWKKCASRRFISWLSL